MKKEGWPEFPFFWLKKPNMSSLQNLASHVHEKAETYRRSGFRGETSEMEKQIIEHMTALEQQVLVLTDVVQALLQIIDDQRTSQRVKRAFRWIREKAKKYGHRVWENTIFKVLGALGTLWFVWFLITLLIRFLHGLKR